MPPSRVPSSPVAPAVPPAGDGTAGTPPSPFNRTVQHDAKRLAILSQAARLFNYKGSRATTLKDIAEKLGLTKTSLYYYVKTKEELIYQCYMAALDYHHGILDTVEARRDTDFVLSDWNLSLASGGSFELFSMENALLRGQAGMLVLTVGDNRFEVTHWTGTATIEAGTGALALTAIWLGTPIDGVAPAQCGHLFE